MKKVRTIFGAILFVSAILASCGSGSKTKNETNNLTDTLKSKIETNDAVSKEIILKPEDIQIGIFFKEIAHSNTEFKPSKTIGKAKEKATFQKQKYCDFNTADCYFTADEPCHIRELFDNLTIKGIGKNISITVSINNKVIFTKEKIELNDELKLSSKEIKMGNPESKYKVVVKQGENILFEGIIEEKSQDCYHG